MEGSGEVTPTPRPRGAGRPSKLAQYAPQIAQWLREDPAPSAVEILRRKGSANSSSSHTIASISTSCSIERSQGTRPFESS